MSEDDIIRSQFRIPADLYRELQVAASKSKRSVNAELVHQLAIALVLLTEPDSVSSRIDALEEETRRLADDQERRLQEVLKRLDALAEVSDEDGVAGSSKKKPTPPRAGSKAKRAEIARHAQDALRPRPSEAVIESVEELPREGQPRGSAFHVAVRSATGKKAKPKPAKK